MIIPIDPKLGLDFAMAGKRWLDDALMRAKKEEARRAARLLNVTGVLLAALHALDNAFRAAFGGFRGFEATWTPEKRSDLILKVSSLADQERILPVIRQYSTDLEMLLKETENSEEREAASNILADVRRILRSFGASPVTPFSETAALETFIVRIRSAKTVEDVMSLLREADILGGNINREVLGAADRAFGRLKSNVLNRYPEIPEPAWVLGNVLMQ